MAESKEWKQKYQEFQLLQSNLQQLSENYEILQQQMGELEISQNALKELQKTPAQTEILAPIAQGVYFKAKLQDAQKLIVNVGCNATIEQSVPEVLEILSQQKGEIDLKIKETEILLQELQSELLKIYHEVEAHVQHSQE